MASEEIATQALGLTGTELFGKGMKIARPSGYVGPQGAAALGAPCMWEGEEGAGRLFSGCVRPRGSAALWAPRGSRLGRSRAANLGRVVGNSLSLFARQPPLLSTTSPSHPHPH